MKRLDGPLWVVGKDLAESLLERLRNTRVSGKAEYRRAMLFFFCKAYKTYQAVELLWSGGYVEDATSVVRSIYELRLQAAFMSRDPVIRSRQFLKHQFKCSIGTLQILRRLNDPVRRSELDMGESVVRDAAESEGMLDLFNNLPAAVRAITKNWWGSGGIKRLLEDLGLEGEYDLIYSQLSDYSHGGVRLLQRYVQLSENSMTMLYRPVRSPSITVPWSAFDWLSQIIGYTGRAFDLNFDETVLRAQEKAKAVLSDTGSAEG
jgi:uncharacterized protein DUF5677